MSLRAPRRLAALLAAPTLVAAGAMIAAPIAGAADSATGDPTYKGSALALSAKVQLAGSNLVDEVLPGLVTYPPGDKKTLIELPDELSQLVALKVLNASSQVENGVLNSNAHTAGLGVLGDVVTAKVLNADCSANQGDVTGDSQVAGLTVAGTKVPVDPGPNMKIEIPDSLASFIKGSIVIDEQTPTKDGGVQIRALHINLVVAPAALSDALNSVIRAVREAAEEVKVVVEEMTGKTLDELVGTTTAPVTRTPATKSAVTKTPVSKKATGTHGAQSSGKVEIRSEAAAPEAQSAPADAAAPAETQKTDGADLDSAAGSAAQDQAEAGDEASTSEATGQTGGQAGDDQAEAARAERSEKGAKAAAPDSTDPSVPAAAPAAPAPAAPAPAQPSDKAADKPADKAPQKAKTDQADLPVVDKVQHVADAIDGALGLDIVVSQVTCDGKAGVKPAVAAVNELPGTGGAGSHTYRNTAVTGLALLAAGGTAVVLTRRRRAIV